MLDLLGNNLTNYTEGGNGIEPGHIFSKETRFRMGQSRKTSIKSIEALKRLNAPDVTKFHKVLLGHWHSPLAHPWYWIGGSVSGTDALDHKQGRHSPPSQAAWMVHIHHGEFNRTDFWL